MAEDKTLVVKAQLNDAVTIGLKKIADGLDTVSASAKKSSGGVTSELTKMGEAAAKDVVIVGKDLTEAHKEASAAAEAHGNKLTQTKEKVLGLADSFLSLATGGMVVGGASQAFDFLYEGIKKSMEEGSAAQQVMASLNASLAMTGKSTGVTSEMADKLAESLSGVTTYSANTIMQGESIMATFDKVGKNTFPQATSMALDLAAKLGIAVPQAARLMGRALEDPVKGVTQLTRFGITLSTQQKDAIKSFMAVNNVAGAQGVVLAALHGRLGNVAQAMGSTFSGRMTILSDQFELMREKIGAGLIPIMGNLMGAVAPLAGMLGQALPVAMDAVSAFMDEYLTPAFNTVDSTIKKVVDVLNSGLGPSVGQAGEKVKAFASFITGASPAADALKGVIIAVGIAFAAYNIQSGIAAATTKAKLIPGLLDSAKAWMANAFAVDSALLPFTLIAVAVAGIILLFVHWYNTNEQFRAAVQTLVRDVLGKLQQLLQSIQPEVQQVIAQFDKFANAIGQRATPVIKELVGLFSTDFPKIRTAVSSTTNGIRAVWDALWPTLSITVKATADIIMAILKTAMNVLGSVIEIALDLLSGNWKQAWSDLTGAVTREWDIINTLLGGGLDDVRDKVMAVIGWFNQWKTPILAVGGAITAFFLPALIQVGVQSAIAGASMAAQFVMAGLQAILGAAADAGLALLSFIINLQATAAAAWQSAIAMGTGFVASVQAGIEAALAFITEALPGMIAGLFTTATAAWSAAAAFIAAEWPILVIIGVIALLVIGIYELVTHWKQVSQFLTMVWSAVVKGVQDGLTWLIDKFTAFGDYLANAWTTNWNNVVSAVSAIWSSILSVVMGPINAIVSSLTSTGTNMYDAVAGPLTGIQQFFMAIWQFIFQFLSAIFGIIGKLILDVFNAYVSIIETVLTALGNLISAAWNFYVSIITTVLTALWGVIQDAWNYVVNIITIALGVLGALFTTMFDTYYTIIVTALNIVGGVINDIWSAIVAVFTAVLDEILNIITVDWAFITSVTSTVWNALSDFFTGILNTIWTTLTGALNNIKNVFATVWNDISSQLLNSWNTLTSDATTAVTTLWNIISGKANDIKNALLQPFNDAASAMPNVIKAFGNGVIGGVNSVIGGIEKFLNDIGGGIDWLSDKLGNGKPIAAVTLSRVPALAKGTDSFEGGVAMVGEQGPELVTLPKGTKVMPADQTKSMVHALHGAVPAFAGGIGDIWGDLKNGVNSAKNAVGGAVNGLKSIAGDVSSWVSEGPDALVSAMLKALGLGKIGLPGVFGGMTTGLLSMLKKDAVSFIGTMLNAVSSTNTGQVGSGGRGSSTGVLSGYPLFNQLALTDVNRDYDCVPTSLASAASFVLGHIVTPVQLKDAVYGAGYQGGTSPGRYAAYLRQLGVGFGNVGGNGSGVISQVIANIQRGIPSIAAIPSDWNNASSQSPTHEIAFAGWDANKQVLTAMNPWGGFWQNGSPAWWGARVRYGNANPITKMANGGTIAEPMLGVGLASGSMYALGENGPEDVTPRSGRGTMSGNVVVENHIYIDGRELGNIAGSHIIQRVRTTTQKKV